MTPATSAGHLRGWWPLTTDQLFDGDPFFMITGEGDVDIHVLRSQDWTITAIACMSAETARQSGTP